MNNDETSIRAILALTMRMLGFFALAGVLVATLFTSVLPPAQPQSQSPNYDQPVHLADSLTEHDSTMVAPITPTLAIHPTRLIGIVAGHKGNDSGAVCPDGLTEASVNLDIATRVQAGLETLGYQVDLLDEFDSRLVGYSALAVLSIHNDSCVYINDEATGFKVAGAVNSGARGETERLVSCLIDRYQARTGLKFHVNSITPDMTQYHTFYEVNPSTPVAIIEAGFLNLDRQILTEQPDLVAQAIVDGLLCFTTNQPVSPTPTTAH